MSRIGKKPITIPEKTEITVSGGTLTVKGPGGTLTREFKSSVSFKVEGKNLVFSKQKDDLETNALWGTYASEASNMIRGVHTPFEKKLIVEGIGFKADVKGDSIVLSLGFSHPVTIKIPDGLKVKSEKGVLTITGANKDTVGEFAAKIRDLKKPEPYKGKGIRYNTEIIRRKQGKKTV